MHRRIVSRDYYHAALDAHVGKCHENVRGHVHAHMLHAGQRAHPCCSGSCCHLHGNLLVGGKFEVDGRVLLLGDEKQVVSYL